MADDGKYKLGAEIARLGRLTDGVSLLIREGQPNYRSWQNSAERLWPSASMKTEE